jgi:hypothetical protein
VIVLEFLSQTAVSLVRPSILALPDAGSSPARSDFFLYGLASTALTMAGCGGDSVALGAAAGLIAAGGAAAWLVRRRAAPKIKRLGPKPSEIVNLDRPETWRRDQAARFWSDPERCGKALRLLRSAVLAQASTGTGIDPMRLPKFFVQTRDECQTMAIFNGALAYDPQVAVRYGRDLDTRITTIRAGASKRSRNGHLDITSVGWEMMAQGYPLKVDVETGRPLDFIRSLFRANAFAVHSGPGHATTFLPLAGPTADRFVFEVDSLGRSGFVPLDGFLDHYLDARSVQFLNLYEWMPPPTRPRPVIKRLG